MFCFGAFPILLQLHRTPMRLHQDVKIPQNIFINLFVNHFKTASI